MVSFAPPLALSFPARVKVVVARVMRPKAFSQCPARMLH